jgi:hypothetical protein
VWGAPGDESPRLKMTKSFPIAAITDEFSPADLDAALDGMAAVGMTGAELRVIGGKNTIELTDEEVDRVRKTIERRGMQCPTRRPSIRACSTTSSDPRTRSRISRD